MLLLDGLLRKLGADVTDPLERDAEGGCAERRKSVIGA